MVRTGEWYDVRFNAVELDQGYGMIETEMQVIEIFGFTCHVRFLNVNGVEDLEEIISETDAERYIKNWKENH